MSTLLELTWSDIPDAEKFIIEADDRPKEFNPGRKIAQSFRTETENTTIIFYFDGDGPEWDIRLTAVRFDGSKYRIKYKTKDWSSKTNNTAKLGFNEVGDADQKCFLIYGKHIDYLTANERRAREGFEPIKSENTHVSETQRNMTCESESVVVLEVPGPITQELAEILKSKIRETFGNDQKVIVLGDHMKLSVLNADSGVGKI